MNSMRNVIYGAIAGNLLARGIEERNKQEDLWLFGFIYKVGVDKLEKQGYKYCKDIESINERIREEKQMNEGLGDNKHSDIEIKLIAEIEDKYSEKINMLSALEMFNERDINELITGIVKCADNSLFDEKKQCHTAVVADRMMEYAEKYKELGIDKDEAYIVGLLHDIGYRFSKNKYRHEKMSEDIAERNGLKYSKVIGLHGLKINNEEGLSSKEMNLLWLLNYVDMTTLPGGGVCSLEERVSDIEERYGEISKSAFKAIYIKHELEKRIKEWKERE